MTRLAWIASAAAAWVILTTAGTDRAARFAQRDARAERAPHPHAEVTPPAELREPDRSAGRSLVARANEGDGDAAPPTRPRAEADPAPLRVLVRRADDGTPISGAAVQAARPRGARWITSEEGEVEIPFARDEVGRVWVKLPGFALQFGSFHDGVDELELRLPRGVTLEVRIRDPLGFPLPDHPVRLERDFEAMVRCTGHWEHDARTDELGVVRFEDIDPRHWTLGSYARMAWGKPDPIEVSFGSGDTFVDLTIPSRWESYAVVRLAPASEHQASSIIAAAGSRHRYPPYDVDGERCYFIPTPGGQPTAYVVAGGSLRVPRAKSEPFWVQPGERGALIEPVMLPQGETRTLAGEARYSR